MKHRPVDGAAEGAGGAMVRCCLVDMVAGVAQWPSYGR